MQSAPTTEPQGGAEEPGLKKGALGLASGVVIGVDSTAPGYSIAAVIAGLVLAVGFQTPGIMLLAFVPMVCVATAYYYMNRVDPDCGTTFAWVTRAMGPVLGWVSGWAILVAGIIVIGSLADVASLFTYLLLGMDGAAESKGAVMGLAVFYIVSMTAIAIRGIELSAMTQFVMITLQVTALVAFAVVVLVQVASGDASPTAVDPELSWFSPFAAEGGSSAITAGLLIAIFIYWGWDSAVAVNEESADSSSGPGKAALLSTVILLGVYLLVSTAMVAYAGTSLFGDFEDDPSVLAVIADDALGTAFGKFLILAVLTSALASTQTTVLPSSRTSLSMARSGALPRRLAAIHPSWQTPHVGTVVVAVLATGFYVVFNTFSQNFLFDALTSLGFLIAFNYGMNGFACVVYHRRELTKSARNFFFVGLAPFVGAAFLTYIFIRSAIDLSDPAASSLASSWFGLGPPFVIGVGSLVVGFVIAFVLRARSGGEGFWARRPEVVAPGQISGVPGDA